MQARDYVKGVWGIIQGTFDPLCCKIICHYLGLKALKMRVLDLVKTVIIQNGNLKMIVCDNRKMWKQPTFEYGPCNSQK